MVESVVRYDTGEPPTLVAEYPVRGSEPVFAGPQPPSHWPSVHVIEGLGQSCTLLSALRLRESGADDNPPGSPANLSAPSSPMGLLASVSVEIQGVARPGECLRYHVTQTHTLDGLSRFGVSAHVKERTIALGAIVGAVMR